MVIFTGMFESREALFEHCKTRPSFLKKRPSGVKIPLEQLAAEVAASTTEEFPDSSTDKRKSDSSHVKGNQGNHGKRSKRHQQSRTVTHQKAGDATPVTAAAGVVHQDQGNAHHKKPEPLHVAPVKKDKKKAIKPNNGPAPESRGDVKPVTENKPTKKAKKQTYAATPNQHVGEPKITSGGSNQLQSKRPAKNKRRKERPGASAAGAEAAVSQP
jgi:hypothetical protein